MCGAGITMILRSELGAAPWDVLHQGISRHTGIPVGTVIIIVGVVLVVAVLAFGTRPGIGTIMNATLIGVTVDAALALTGKVERLPTRALLLGGGIVLFGLGSAVYIGTGLGAGPRDGLMTTLAGRGWSIRWSRTLIEIVVVVVGVAFGGTIGIGTAAFALGIGPIIQLFLPWLTMGAPVVAPRPGGVAVAVSGRTQRHRRRTP